MAMERKVAFFMKPKSKSCRNFYKKSIKSKSKSCRNLRSTKKKKTLLKLKELKQ